MSESKTFALSPASEIIVYGAGRIGLGYAEALLRHGYNVIAFFDLRAEKIKNVIFDIDGATIDIPVHEYRSYAASDTKKTAVVVFSIRDASVHSHMASILFKDGYGNLIYKPSPHAVLPLDPKTAHALDAFYNVSLAEGKIPQGMVFPVFTPVEESDACFPDRCFIAETGDTVTAWAPLELVFSSLGSPGRGARLPEKFHDTHISLLSPYVELFQLFDSGYGDVEPYLNMHTLQAVPKTGVVDEAGERINLLTGLDLLYQEYARELNAGMEFFVQNPLELQWNKGGYFNIAGDMYKAAFFLIKKLKRIPATMSRGDYEAWLNTPVLREVIETIRQTRTVSTYAPLPHPRLSGFPAIRERYGSSRLYSVLKFLAGYCDYDFSRLSVLDVGCFHGYYSQQLARLGARVAGVEIDAAEYQVARKLNALFYHPAIDVHNCGIQDFPAAKEYDVVFLLTVLYHWLADRDECIKMIKKIDALTRGVLVWESGEFIEDEKKIILENSSFKTYRMIEKTYGTGRIRELGVFFKHPPQS